MNIKAVVSKVENHIYWKKIEWGFYDKMDDESFLKMAYKRKFGKELDLKNPVTFNEKLQWLKLHDRKPEYTTMVDKYEAKAYIAQKIGKEYVVPTLGVWDKFDDIDFTKLPNAFVLKCTHDTWGFLLKFMIAGILLSASCKVTLPQHPIWEHMRYVSEIIYFTHMWVAFSYTLIFREFRYYGADIFFASTLIPIILYYILYRSHMLSKVKTIL